MKVEKVGNEYQVTLSRKELLAFVNALAEKQAMIREIYSIINPDGGKKKDKQLDKLRQEMIDVLGS